MPNIEKQYKRIYHMINGEPVLQEVIEIEVEVPTEEELIQEKEAQLLQMYQELQDLKNKS